MRRIGLAVCTGMMVAMATAAVADSTEGKVIAYDRKAQVVVMEDRTVYSLANFDAPVLAELKAGDMVMIDFEGEGEDGYGLVTEIEIKN